MFLRKKAIRIVLMYRSSQALFLHSAWLFSFDSKAPAVWRERFARKSAGAFWYRGAPSNAAEQMYVVLNDSAVVNHDSPTAALKGSWTEWNIDLMLFVDQGINLTNVNTITIGFGNRNNPVAGGVGMVFFDDIRLCAR